MEEIIQNADTNRWSQTVNNTIQSIMYYVYYEYLNTLKMSFDFRFKYCL